jgi:hypothetical protein
MTKGTNREAREQAGKKHVEEEKRYEHVWQCKEGEGMV